MQTNKKTHVPRSVVLTAVRAAGRVARATPAGMGRVASDTTDGQSSRAADYLAETSEALAQSLTGAARRRYKQAASIFWKLHLEHLIERAETPQQRLRLLHRHGSLSDVARMRVHRLREALKPDLWPHEIYGEEGVGTRALRRVAEGQALPDMRQVVLSVLEGLRLRASNDGQIKPLETDPVVSPKDL